MKRLPSTEHPSLGQMSTSAAITMLRVGSRQPAKELASAIAVPFVGRSTVIASELGDGSTPFAMFYDPAVFDDDEVRYLVQLAKRIARKKEARRLGTVRPQLLSG
jgi:hypothetical protein